MDKFKEYADAPAGDEATLFRLAAQLEQASPWFDRRPPIGQGN